MESEGSGERGPSRFLLGGNRFSNGFYLQTAFLVWRGASGDGANGRAGRGVRDREASGGRRPGSEPWRATSFRGRTEEIPDQEFSGRFVCRDRTASSRVNTRSEHRSRTHRQFAGTQRFRCAEFSSGWRRCPRPSGTRQYIIITWGKICL